MNKFAWGKVIERFDYDFDGDKVEVVKYYPSTRNDNVPHFHIEELHESSDSLQYMLIAYIARKNLGLNQHSLVSGICRALEVK